MDKAPLMSDDSAVKHPSLRDRVMKERTSLTFIRMTNTRGDESAEEDDFFFFFFFFMQEMLRSN